MRAGGLRACPTRLLRVGIARVHHAYMMVCEYGRTARQLHFRHVATCTVLVRHGTSLLRRGMARQASPVVTGILANQIRVRIVASRTAYALVVPQEALAVG